MSERQLSWSSPDHKLQRLSGGKTNKTYKPPPLRNISKPSCEPSKSLALNAKHWCLSGILLLSIFSSVLQNKLFRGLAS